MSYDPKDDVDRLFACFKCGLSPPQSALKERKTQDKSKRPKSVKGEPSMVEQATEPATLDVPTTSSAIKFTSGKKISPLVFYGSPHGAPVKRPAQLLKLLREIRVDLREQNKLIPRDEVWATFPRQEEAVRFAKTHSQVFVFSYQDHLSGTRRFLVSTHDAFWKRYRKMDPKLRHHYEVIQEGLPCHLYFDLEFNKKVNSDRNVDEMVDILISITFKTLFDKYSIQGSQEWVVELDSSNEEKFSRHLVIRIPNTAFKDNSHVGALVSEVCSRIASLRGSDPHFEKIYVRKDSSSPDCPDQLFLDSAVYTRNRCFRLVLSSKAGKNSFLLPTGRFRKNMGEKEVFMESLISRLDVDCNKLLVCKMDLDCQKVLCFDSEVHHQNQDVQHYVPSITSGNPFPSSYFTGKSPFPCLDVFVESIASTGNVSGKIRSWYWFSSYGLMIYSMSRNRYCERIGREHKSNHVMYIVDFQRAGYYQKCYDPDCKGYRSPLRPLPLDVIPDSSAVYNSTCTGNYMDIGNTDLELQIDGSDMEHQSCDGGLHINDSCTKDSPWWQEAATYADCIEKIKGAPDFRKLDEDMDEDCEWWMDAEKIVSQVETKSIISS